MTWTAWMQANSSFVQAITSIVTTLLTLGGGLIIGQALTARWNIRVKEREADLTAIQRVRQLYGDFISTKRLWDYHCTTHNLKELDARGLDLLDRASAAEGEMEAILIKIASEWKLAKQQLDDLGLFRQGCQQLREHIRHCKPLSWESHDHPQYLAFKRGAQKIIEIISNQPREMAPAGQFEIITSNIYETQWKRLAAQ